MIIVVGGIKGGSGKSTIATNLTILLAQKKDDVLLIDADDQETATDFTIIRNKTLPKPTYTSIKLGGHAVRTETLLLSEKYKNIVIDVGGRDTTSQRAALTVANIALIPFVPRSFDIWTIEKLTQLADEIKNVNSAISFYSFLNKADPRGTDNKDAIDILKDSKDIQYINCPIGNRKTFANASSQGLGITEFKPKDIKAIAELNNLVDIILK